MAVVISLFLGVLMFCSAPVAAQLIGEATLAPVLKWMAALPAISALWVAPNAKPSED